MATPPLVPPHLPHADAAAVCLLFFQDVYKRQFKQVPREVIEAARMDHAKNRTIMLKVMLPMIAPVLVTHLITSFISNWNEYYWVLVMTNTQAIRTPVSYTHLDVYKRQVLQGDIIA